MLSCKAQKAKSTLKFKNRRGRDMISLEKGKGALFFLSPNLLIFDCTGQVLLPKCHKVALQFPILRLWRDASQEEWSALLSGMYRLLEGRRSGLDSLKG